MQTVEYVRVPKFLVFQAFNLPGKIFSRSILLMPLIVSTPSSSELSLLLHRKSDLEVSSSCRSSRWRTREVRATRKTGQMTSAQAEGNPPSPRSGPLKKKSRNHKMREDPIKRTLQIILFAMLNRV